MKRYGKIGVFLALTLLVAIWSCNKKFDRLLPSTAYNDSTNTYKAPKVLYIIVDGARGWSVRDANAPTINSLIGKSIYSWYSVSDSLGNDGNGWADMLTGVTKAKHKVIDNTFAGNNLAQYPTIFSRIKTISPNSRLASFSASATFKNNLTAGADVSQSFAADSLVRSAIVTELGNDASTFVVGEFNGVNTAGTTYGYDNSFPQYKAAILQFDQYLGQMLTALKARKNYAKENWLVIVTSNHGGTATIPPAQNDKTILSYPVANTFTIIYNDNYTTKLIDKPFTGSVYTGNFLHLYSTANADANSVYAKVTNDVYNLGDTASTTIEFKVKKTILAGKYTYQWPIVLSKKDTSLSKRVGRGWSIAMEIDTWRFLMYNSAGGSFAVNGLPLTDGNWHSCAVVITNSSVNRVVRLYQDGVKVSETVIPATIGNIDNSSPLRLGYILTDNTNTFDGYMSEIRIWRTALSDATIALYSCQGQITSTHPNYPYLIGYWKGNDGSGLVLKDSSPAGNDLKISVGKTTTLQWNSQTDIICPPSSATLSALVPRNVDMPRQILSWLTISPPDSWGLNGRVWLNN